MKQQALLFLSGICVCALLFIGCHDQRAPGQTLESYESEEIPSGQLPVFSQQSRNISIQGDQFADATGRTLLLRGINVGGDSKVPYTPNGATHIAENFFQGENISFTGRPFPLAEADEHLARLQAWGFHFFRFLVTWEAIEHEGPGLYDTAYIAYVRSLIEKANTYDITVLIDPHQDVWSRFSGGDGAPLWLFDSLNMEVRNFQETGAAFVHNVYGDPFPRMIWYTNNFKLATATLFTLFFGGKDFAPQTYIDGLPAQDYMQQHYIQAMAQLAQALKGLPNVVGFELMNEPSSGYIGLEDLRQPYHTDIVGDAPTPLQGMLAGNGIPQKIQRYRVGAASLKEDGQRLLNPDSLSIWKDHKPGIWVQNGLLQPTDSGGYTLSNPAYFTEVNGQKVDFNADYYLPFAEKYARALQAIDSNWAICVDDILFPYPLELPDLKNIPDVQWMNGSHWYDDVTLVKKQYLPFLGFYQGQLVFGKKKVQKAYEKTLANMKAATRAHFGEVPSLLGEFGIPFDMNQSRAYRSGNFKTQSKALDRSMRIAEKNLYSYTLWNYTASNTHAHGDQWNGEDLSIFSLSQQTKPADLNSGGRSLDAAIRPYPKKVNGELLEYQYAYKKKELLVRFKTTDASSYPTEIFLPEYVYHDSFRVQASSGALHYDAKQHTLLFYTPQEGMHTLIIEPK